METVVIPDDSIEFPVGCEVIMGVNMMANNEIDVSVRYQFCTNDGVGTEQYSYHIFK